jgi:hypothetical protein
MTPTARTVQLLRKAGFLAEVVERWLPIPGKSVRRDLFYIGDVLAVDPIRKTFFLVQCTSLDHVADRLAKAKGRPELETWLRAGGSFEVWGWSKRGVKRVAVTGEDLAAETIVTPPRRRRRLDQGTLF